MRLVSNNFSTRDLINNAEIVATISGTAGFEAALLGKNVILFGEAWFKGMPNTYLWENLESFEDLMNKKISSVEEIKMYFKTDLMKTGLVGFQNLSSAPRYQRFFNETFFKDQRNDLLYTVCKFIENHVS